MLSGVHIQASNIKLVQTLTTTHLSKSKFALDHNMELKRTKKAELIYAIQKFYL